jgi:hypothetical protein
LETLGTVASADVVEDLENAAKLVDRAHDAHRNISRDGTDRVQWLCWVDGRWARSAGLVW